MRTRLVLLAIVAVIVLFGLEVATPQRVEEAAVRRRVHAFMEARMGRDTTRVRAFLSPVFDRALTASDELTLVGAVDPHFRGYQVHAIEPGGQNAWRVDVTIFEAMAGYGDAGSFTESLTVVRAGDTYLIDAIERGPHRYAPP